MNLEQFQMFLEVTELGSFQKVAEKNLITQRAVSERMKRLEEELDTQLFIRSRNKIELTMAGRFFKQRALKVINLVRDTSSELKNMNKVYQPRLTIGYFSPFDAIILKQGIYKIRSEIDPIITEEGVEHLITDVLMGDLDCAFIMDDYGFNQKLSKAGLSSITVDHDKMLLGISQYLITDSKVISTEMVKSLPVIYYSNEESDYLRRAFLQNLGKIGHGVDVRRVHSFEQMQTLVSLGKAISFYPSNLVKLLTNDKQINYLPLEANIDQSFSFKLIYRKGNSSMTLKKFIKACKLVADVLNLDSF
ncbi:LysR family transcriptional regulator [Limosilactobacillus caccae]|uniref:LysR family transcriptional regulator n=1 Tax=Limosilactobacillus caccae TaxID=1926284 RepID=UPI00190ED826|nr:LysR family transcriptional regulator [Limosilactobacillus caccae]